ncbi:hypothetical protein CR513_47774, partial [Mucuna pruriens]
MMWHHRLGHMFKQGLKVLMERNLLPGLKEVSLTFCEHCVISKQHKLKFARVTTKGKHILDLIHFNVWESLEISMEGAKYFVSFIDDYSRRLWVYPIKTKSSVFSQFKEFKAQVELETGRKIKCLRTDNGGEYVDGEFLAFCKQEGIVRQFSVPHTPQQNGVAERMNRTLLERIRAMLRIVETLMEMWKGKLVDYFSLHLFGCPVYVMYNSQERTKLDPKSRKCIFLGYADNVKGYRLWDPTAHKVIVSRNVVFAENELQNEQTNNSTTTSIIIMHIQD